MQCCKPGCTNEVVLKRRICKVHITAQRREAHAKSVRAKEKPSRAEADAQQREIDRIFREREIIKFAKKIYTKEEIQKIAHQITSLDKIRSCARPVLLPDYF
jgi:hypothetical protein